MYDEVSDLETTYRPLMNQPQSFPSDLNEQFQNAWTRVTLYNANLLFAKRDPPSSFKFLSFEYLDDTLPGGAYFWTSELTRRSCFTRREMALSYGIKDQAREPDRSYATDSDFAVQVDPKQVPYVFLELYNM